MASFSQKTFHYHTTLDEKISKSRLIGLELEVEREDRDEVDWLKTASKEQEGFAAFGYDGADIEVVTDPISIGLVREGGKLIEEVLNTITEHDCITCPQGGTHINVSKLPTDYKWTYDNLLWLQMVYIEEMRKVFGRKSHWAETPLKSLSYGSNTKNHKILFDIFINQVPNVAKTFSGGNSKSILITNKRNRYEFRGGKSSTSLLEVLAWSEFCYNIVEIAATKQDLKGVQFKDFLEGEFIKQYIEAVVNTSESRKLTDQELNKAVGRTKKITIMKGYDKIFE